MKNHDNEATIYVCTLGPKQVTRPQKQCLLRIANHWTSRYQCTCIAKADLCDDLMIVPRQLRRILSALTLKGIIEYTPGLGAGNWSTFRFPKIGTDSGRKEEAKGTQRGHKRDISDTPNKEENLNLNQKQDCRGLDFESRSVLLESEGIALSSSEIENDDGLEISQIIRAFESCPLTVGKATLADRATAKRLLRSFSVEEVEYSAGKRSQGDQFGVRGSILGVV